jgi:hypothetical protein
VGECVGLGRCGLGGDVGMELGVAGVELGGLLAQFPDAGSGGGVIHRAGRSAPDQRLA